jgi:hypothetical protein
MAGIPGIKHGASRFNIGDAVFTKSGLAGRIIGAAEYHSGWEYRIQIPGRSKTIYRKEAELEKANRSIFDL